MAVSDEPLNENKEAPKDRPKRKRTLFRWVALLLAMTLVIVGYLQRERLLKLIQPRDAGQMATITLAYLPGRAFRGRVAYIYPQLDNTTRTLKARIEVHNHGLTLKPDMYANVELQINYGMRVVAPEEAVMDSGAEALVFVAREGGYFEPRKVTIGAKVGNEVIVLNGLKPGERVVTSANFLIDSESRLKSAASGMGMPGMSHGGGAPAGGKPSPPAGHPQHQ